MVIDSRTSPAPSDMAGTSDAAGTAGTAVTLADARRQATLDELLLRARQFVMQRGLDVTMDEIAENVGVGRRTLFRHFESRERLLAQALEAGVQRYGELLPRFSGDWRSWLHDVCATAHRMQAGYGPGYWELTNRTDLAPEIAAVEARRDTRRRQAMTRIAHKLWVESGGVGDTPDRVRASVGAHLSPRFTAAVVTDVGQAWETAADLAESAIVSAVDGAVAEHSR